MFVLGSGRPSTFTFPEGLGGSISVSSARNGRAFSLARRSERQDKFTMIGSSFVLILLAGALLCKQHRDRVIPPRSWTTIRHYEKIIYS